MLISKCFCLNCWYFTSIFIFIYNTMILNLFYYQLKLFNNFKLLNHSLHYTILKHYEMILHLLYQKQVRHQLIYKLIDFLYLPFIIWSCYWFKWILTSCIPYLYFYCFIILSKYLRSKFYTNSCIMFISKLFFCISQKYAWFSYITITNYNKFK